MREDLRIDSVSTYTTILTRPSTALVDVSLAIGASVAWLTLTLISTHLIDTHSVVHTQIRVTLIYIMITILPSVPILAETFVIVD